MNILEMKNEDSGNIEQSETTNTSSAEQGNRPKRIRNSSGPRNFVCGCSKMYLSYPAIYTHVRNKHGGRFPANSYIHKDSGLKRSFNILGKSNKDSITLTGKVIEPSAFTEILFGFSLEARNLLLNLGLNAEASEVV